MSQCRRRSSPVKGPLWRRTPRSAKSGGADAATGNARQSPRQSDLVAAAENAAQTVPANRPVNHRSGQISIARGANATARQPAISCIGASPTPAIPANHLRHRATASEKPAHFSPLVLIALEATEHFNVCATPLPTPQRLRFRNPHPSHASGCLRQNQETRC